MSERDRILIEVQKLIKINTANITAATGSVVMCEVNVKTYQRMLIKLDELHKVKIDKVQKQIDGYVRNLKEMHGVLDGLLAEKEDLHNQLKAAIHHGEVQCEYCLKYYTSAGIARHTNACASKPTNEVVEKHKAEIDEVTEDIEARKAKLREELKSLEKE